MTYQFDFSFLAQYWPAFLGGAWLTIKLTVVSIALGFIVGTVSAVLRVYAHPIAGRVIGAYVEIIRNTPLLVQIFIVYFGIASCLGLNRLQVITHVVLLPAVERVYPALTSQFVLLMLASSITSQISAEELTAVANVIQSDTYRSFEVYVVVAIVYLCLSFLYRLGFWGIGLALFARRRRLGTAL